MRKMAFILAMLLLFCGCSLNGQQKTEFIEGVHYAPNLYINYAGESFVATKGSGNWTYKDENGKEIMECGLGFSALECEEIISFPAGKAETAEIVFGEGMVSYDICRWKVGSEYLFDGIGPEFEVSEKEEILLDNGILEVPNDGNYYVYEIYIRYENGDNYYSFRIDPADSWGVTLSVTDVTPTGAMAVFEQQGGNFEGELNFGSYYRIERDGKELGYTVEGDIGWTAEAYMIALNGVTRMETNWQWLYGELEPGEYVIYKTVMNFRGPGDFDEKVYSAKFVVE